jgi:hypothetical protein
MALLSAETLQTSLDFINTQSLGTIDLTEGTTAAQTHRLVESCLHNLIDYLQTLLPANRQTARFLGD